MDHTLKYHKNTGIILLAYFILMLLFAFSWHFALPYKGSINNYLDMIANKNWVPINLIGWLGIACGIFAINSLFEDVKKKLGKVGKTGFLIVFSAFLIHFCLVSWEAFLWPEIGRLNQSAFLLSEGVFIKSSSIIVLYSLFSLTFSVGFLLLGISLVRSRIFPKIPVLMTIIGAFVYAFAVAFGGYMGLVSFTLYLLGILSIGVVIIRKSKN